MHEHTQDSEERDAIVEIGELAENISAIVREVLLRMMNVGCQTDTATPHEEHGKL